MMRQRPHLSCFRHPCKPFLRALLELSNMKALPSSCEGRFSLLALLGLALLTSGCASLQPLATASVQPAAACSSTREPSGASLGVVLTGGGAFGAWEVGALEALFEYWCETYGEDPPIRVVAGTSTGALIAPFALLGRSYLPELESWYTSVRQADIAAPRLGVVLPFPLFAITTSSVYSVGYTADDARPARLLYRRIEQALPAERLHRLGALWPNERLVVTSLDFGSGRPRSVTNSTGDIDTLRAAMLASAVPPLAFPPVPLRPADAPPDSPRRTPHFDGGVCAVAPFEALLETAAREPAIKLTHIVAISAFPEFPAAERDPVQVGEFPQSPAFKAIGDRMNVLLSEASATKEIGLVRAAIALRHAGVPSDEVKAATRIAFPCPQPDANDPPTWGDQHCPPPVLVVLAPDQRLGWRALSFDPDEMREMLDRGRVQARAKLEAGLSPVRPSP